MMDPEGLGPPLAALLTGEPPAPAGARGPPVNCDESLPAPLTEVTDGSSPPSAMIDPHCNRSSFRAAAFQCASGEIEDATNCSLPLLLGAR